MIVFVIAMAVIAATFQFYILEHGLEGLDYSLELEKYLAEPQEVVGMSSVICNQKRMMLPSLRIRENLPDGVCIHESLKGKESQGDGIFQRAYLETRLYLAGWQKVEIQRKVSFSKRGSYRFPEVSLDAGDFLGITSKRKMAEGRVEIVVKPEPSQNVQMQQLLGGFLGNVSVRRFWMEDPMIPAGFREYTGREAFRDISWTHSARCGTWMVKEYDHTADLSCLVLLDISCREVWKKDMEERTEECFSMARTVCEMLEERDFSYEFMTNAVVQGPLGTVQGVWQGKGKIHLEEILEILGRATHHFGDHLPSLLHYAEAKRGENRTCILISLEEWRECQEEILHLRNMTGYEVLSLYPQAAIEEDQ